MPIPSRYIDRLPDYAAGTLGAAAVMALELASSLRGAARLLDIPITTYRRWLFDPDYGPRQTTRERFIEASRALPGEFIRPPTWRTWRTTSAVPGAGFTAQSLAETQLPVGASMVHFAVRDDSYAKGDKGGWKTVGNLQIGGRNLSQIAASAGLDPADIGAINVFVS